MSYLEKAQNIYDMVYQGQLLEAFEKYYADDVVMVEANGDSTEGKDANREREKKFLESVQEWHAGGVKSIASNEDAGVTMIENWMEVTFKGAPGPMKMEQVAVQKWEGDQIVHERFYYNMPG